MLCTGDFMIFGTLPDYSRLLSAILLLLLVFGISAIMLGVTLVRRSRRGWRPWSWVIIMLSIAGMSSPVVIAVVLMTLGKSEMRSCVSRVVLSLGEPITSEVLRQPEFCKVEPPFFLSQVFEAIPWYPQGGTWGLLSNESFIDLTVNYKGRVLRFAGVTRVDMTPGTKRDNFQDSISVSNKVPPDALLAYILEACGQLSAFVSDVKQCEVAAHQAMETLAAKQTVILNLKFVSDDMTSYLRVVSGVTLGSPALIRISVNTR